MRVDGVGTPISRPQRDSFGTKSPKVRAADSISISKPSTDTNNHGSCGYVCLTNRIWIDSYGAVFMILGYNAAITTVLALQKDQAVQDVEYNELRIHLIDDRQIIENSE